MQTANTTLIQKETNDSTLVTEVIIPMGKFWSRFLALWFTIIGLYSIYIVTLCMPYAESDYDKQMAKIKTMDSLSSIYVVVLQNPKSDSNQKGEALKWLAKNYNVAQISSAISQPNLKDGSLFISQLNITKPSQLVYIIVFFSGALGGCIHGLASLVTYRGRRRLFRSWVQWYLIKPLMSAFVGFTFIIILQTGLLSSNQEPSPENTNLMGLISIALLAGLAAETATDKLRSIFEAAFGKDSKKNAESADTTDPSNIENSSSYTDGDVSSESNNSNEDEEQNSRERESPSNITS
jgi:hypothetical protein